MYFDFVAIWMIMLPLFYNRQHINRLLFTIPTKTYMDFCLASFENWICVSRFNAVVSEASICKSMSATKFIKWWISFWCINKIRIVFPLSFWISIYIAHIAFKNNLKCNHTPKNIVYKKKLMPSELYSRNAFYSNLEYKTPQIWLLCSNIPRNAIRKISTINNTIWISLANIFARIFFTF